MEKNKIINNIFFILLIVNIVVLFISIKETFSLNELTFKSKIIKDNINNNCSGNDIFFISECLNKELKRFYYYNYSNINKKLSLQELKEQGGVCLHYANWYKEQFISLGAKDITGKRLLKEKEIYNYYVETVEFSTNNMTSHMVTIVSNDDGYCLLDMINMNCLKFEK